MPEIKQECRGDAKNLLVGYQIDLSEEEIELKTFSKKISEAYCFNQGEKYDERNSRTVKYVEM